MKARFKSRILPYIASLAVLLACPTYAVTSGATAPEQVVHIYLDADLSGAKASGVSIERGIRTALDEANGTVGDFELKLLVRDHRGNSGRSKDHLDEFLEDAAALAVVSGLHSPPLLAHRDFINENEILVMDPWAAAGPITRYPSANNWIFRLSVDDTKAGYVISQYAVEERGFRRPLLVLENTGWGKSNERTMEAALEELGTDPVGVLWFNWSLTDRGAKELLMNARALDPDCIFFVGNSNEAKTLVQNMARLPEEQRIPICSHWGLTGGDFPKVIGADIRSNIDLTFIQTSFSFVSSELSVFQQLVFNRCQALFPGQVKTYADLEAPTGFIHAYDLTRILIEALKQIEPSGNALEDRRRTRIALEHLRVPVQGLIKVYEQPFGVWSGDNPDAHEALEISDYKMARYGDRGQIELVK